MPPIEDDDFFDVQHDGNDPNWPVKFRFAFDGQRPDGTTVGVNLVRDDDDKTWDIMLPSVERAWQIVDELTAKLPPRIPASTFAAS